MSDLEPINNAFTDYLISIARKAEEAPEDYRDENGILHCGKCREEKEVKIDLGGQSMVVACMCRCESEQYDARERRFREDQRRMRIERLRVQGINDDSLRSARFENAEQTEHIQMCQEYCKHWDKVRKENLGMIFLGDKGNGKTFCAACIANDLIDQGVPVLMTSFPAILSAGHNGMNDLIREAQEFDLVIVDDLGAERDTEYAMETVYHFIDARYRTGKPVIITTNLGLDELRHPKDIRYGRIYDRVLEMCSPVVFKGESRRVAKRKDKAALLREIMNGDTTPT